MVLSEILTHTQPLPPPTPTTMLPVSETIFQHRLAYTYTIPKTLDCDMQNYCY